ncbi:MAG: type VI secretion system tip protein TssI/VgrG [Sandaracinaceae bacterium]
MTDVETIFTSAGQDGVARVLSVRGREALGEPYRYEVEVLCPMIDPNAARGGPAVVELAGGGRIIAGVVETLEMVGRSIRQARWDGHYFRVVIVPRHWQVLRYRHNFRIFQEQTVVEIIQAILADAGIGEDTVNWDGVTGSYPARTYTVQYDESEWDFISRLMEEEGIFYTFEHLPDSSKMVFMDSNSAFQPTDPQSITHFDNIAQDAFTYGLWDWTERRRIVESKVTLRDYDFERPSVDLTVEASADEAIEREHYAYPGYYTDEGEGARLAQVRLDAFRSHRVTATSKTNMFSATPGQWFTLADHTTFDGDHIIRSVEVDVVRARPDGSPIEPTVTIRLGTLPREQTFRSTQRTPKPRVIGLRPRSSPGRPARRSTSTTTDG